MTNRNSTVEIKDGVVTVSRDGDEKEKRAQHGLARALINNMVVGVSEGYQKKLEIVGVGYKAEKKGKKLVLSLGFSHPVELDDPDGIETECPSLTEIPELDTSSCTRMHETFSECSLLETVPLLDTSSCIDMSGAFSGVLNLTDASLDNILQMCINVNQNYQYDKTLVAIGISDDYDPSQIEALEHYQDFINAGWTIS